MFATKEEINLGKDFLLKAFKAVCNEEDFEYNFKIAQNTQIDDYIESKATSSKNFTSIILEIHLDQSTDNSICYASSIVYSLLNGENSYWHNPTAALSIDPEFGNFAIEDASDATLIKDLYINYYPNDDNDSDFVMILLLNKN